MDSIDHIADRLDFLISSPLALPCAIAHYCIVISGIKKTWGESQARSQPFATWFMSMICCFGGGCLVNFFVGKPPLAPFTSTESLVYATTLWWLIFYAPRNTFSTLVEWTPISLILLLLKEMIRTRKIIKGVTLARAAYPSSFLLCAVLGMLSACGGGFIKNTALLLRSQWNQHSIKTFSFSLLTKFCLVFAALYNLQLNGQLPFSMKVVALLQVTFIYGATVGGKFGLFTDIFLPLETILCSLFVDYSAFSTSEPVEVQKSSSKRSNKNTKKD